METHEMWLARMDRREKAIVASKSDEELTKLAYYLSGAEVAIVINAEIARRSRNLLSK